jgi:hypothetical protein
MREEQEQETLYVLQNKSLMEQIERSLKTHGEGTGRRLSPEELDALDHTSERFGSSTGLGGS